MENLQTEFIAADPKKKKSNPDPLSNPKQKIEATPHWKIKNEATPHPKKKKKNFTQIY